MILNLPRELETDIMQFCSLNEIKDVNSFLVMCIRDGFNISKYGTSPIDNFSKENKPFKIDNNYEIKQESNSEGLEEMETKRKGRPRKESAKEEESLSGKEIKAEDLMPKKKIRIIKK